jgi:peroxiredoxin Q/BCP
LLPKQDADATDNDTEKRPAQKVPEVDDTIDIETFGGESARFSQEKHWA